MEKVLPFSHSKRWVVMKNVQNRCPMPVSVMMMKLTARSSRLEALVLLARIVKFRREALATG
jgi:hypothetical protein